MQVHKWSYIRGSEGHCVAFVLFSASLLVQLVTIFGWNGISLFFTLLNLGNSRVLSSGEPKFA